MLERRLYLVYGEEKLNNYLDAVGEPVKIAPNLWVVYSGRTVVEILGAYTEFVDGDIPTFVCELTGERAFSVRGIRPEVEAHIRSRFQ